MSLILQYQQFGSTEDLLTGLNGFERLLFTHEEYIYIRRI